MATSRYGNTGNAPQLDPNTQQSTGSSTSSGSSSQSQGIFGQDKRNLQTLINTLLYGTSNPQTSAPVYKDVAGNTHTQQEYELSKKYKGYSNRGKGPYIHPQPITEITQAANFRGTAAMQEGAASKKKVMDDLTKMISSYSPKGASADSALAMQALLRKSMEANMPAIQRSIENAGTSGGSQEALLSQDLATRSAGEAATLGLKAKSEYGQISANLAKTLGDLSGQEDPVVSALLRALEATRTGQQSETRSQTETRTSGPIGLTSPQLFPPN